MLFCGNWRPWESVSCHDGKRAGFRGNHNNEHENCRLADNLLLIAIVTLPGKTRLKMVAFVNSLWVILSKDSAHWEHDDVIKWRHFPRYSPFVRGIHRSPVNSPHKGQWRGSLMFSFICAWIYSWVNSREAGDLRRHRAHHDVIVMRKWLPICTCDF